MLKLFRILGKRGRVTIPYEIRQRVGFRYNDVLSFTQADDNTVIVKREVICDESCPLYSDDGSMQTESMTLTEFLDGLTEEEQKAALIHLSANWAMKQGGTNRV